MRTDHQDNWRYERAGRDSDSKQQARAVFLRQIEINRPQVVSDLFENAFPEFVDFVQRRFKSHLPNVPILGSVSWPVLFRVLRHIPELETRAIINWDALKRMRGSQALCSRLVEWSERHNLNVDWCFDHTIRTLRSWFFDENVCWTGSPPESPRILGRGVLSSWNSAITELEFHLSYSRFELSVEILPNHGDPPGFKLARQRIGFECAGWNYLQDTKKEWQAKVQREFDRYAAKLVLQDCSLPQGIRTWLRKEMTSYLKKQDAERSSAINRHALVKRALHYAETHGSDDHIKWLVLYHVPTCETYAQIARKSGKNSETIRKYVGEAAKNIGLPMRDSRLHSGRRRGSGGTSPRRVRHREKKSG